MINKMKYMVCLSAVFGISASLSACGDVDMIRSVSNDVSTESSSTEEDWTLAESTPLGRYPELVTYTLGKQTDSNHSNMPVGDTYENNNYTRYLQKVLNVQNKDILEGQDSMQYEQLEYMAVMEGNMPDVMIVTSKEMLDYLVHKDMIADLTEVYANCTSDRIKEMYASYGIDKLGSATYDGRLMAFPETEVYHGPALIWLRKDWMDQLGLEEPKTLGDALHIIAAFHEQNPGQNAEGNIGLAMDPVLVEKTDQCFCVSPILDAYHAYPGKWIPTEDGQLIYGSVTAEMKEVLSCLHNLYDQGVLDPDFMIRNTRNLPELLADGRCGAFFGWWWAPNAPLFNVYDGHDNWQPYVVSDSEQYETTLSYGRHYYVVVRKDYEHPEVVPKILTALYDYARYDGKQDAQEVGAYLGANVGPDATPLNINLDYSDITFRVTKNLKAVEAGQMRYEDLTVLEQGYWNSYDHYRSSTKPDATDWAAYSSRMNAVAKLNELSVTYVNKDYTSYVDQLYIEELKKMEEKTFIQIITGEKPVDAFDEFVKLWYEGGGQNLTDKANTYF